MNAEQYARDLDLDVELCQRLIDGNVLRGPAVS